MNTKKTLADVRPGGRVRLGDAPWPEIDAILADAYSAGATGLPFEGIARRHAVCAAFAALSAQPSPGGQGDTQHVLVNAAHLERVLVCAEGNHFDDCMADRTTTITRAIEQMREALAARQPVRSSTVSDDMMDVVDRLGFEYEDVDSRAWDHMLIYAPTEKLVGRLATRQLVGEPIGWFTDDHLTDRSATTYDRTVADRWRAKGWPVSPLYAAPAQAVGLGLQLDRYDAGLLGDGGGGDVGWWQDYIRAELDRAHEFYQDQADAHG